MVVVETDKQLRFVPSSYNLRRCGSIVTFFPYVRIVVISVARRTMKMTHIENATPDDVRKVCMRASQILRKLDIFLDIQSPMLKFKKLRKT